MEQVIAKMRADWSVIAKARLESGEWTAEDVKDIGAAVAVAVAAKSPDQIAMWSRWLADLAAWACAWNLICRGAEVAMRAKAAEVKAAAAAKKAG